jgi:hypothetical protein
VRGDTKEVVGKIAGCRRVAGTGASRARASGCESGGGGMRRRRQQRQLGG